MSPQSSVAEDHDRGHALDEQPKWAKCLGKDVLELPRTTDVFSKIEADRFLSYRLPPAQANAGAVLHHAVAVFEGLHLRKSPMTFKFGFSHCAHFRWHNPAFGYKHDLANKFEHLMVLYLASDPIGPAFLEAALIQRYRGYLIAACMTVCLTLLLNLVHPCMVTRLSCGVQGTPGCKNIRRGGDTTPSMREKAGPYLTYIVFRSFKEPPQLKPGAH